VAKVVERGGGQPRGRGPFTGGGRETPSPQRLRQRGHPGGRTAWSLKKAGPHASRDGGKSFSHVDPSASRAVGRSFALTVISDEIMFLGGAAILSQTPPLRL